MSAYYVDVIDYIVYVLAAFLVRISNIVPVHPSWSTLLHNRPIIQMDRAT